MTTQPSPVQIQPTSVQTSTAAIIDAAVKTLYCQLGAPGIADVDLHEKIVRLVAQRQQLMSLTLSAAIDPVAQAHALQRLAAATSQLTAANESIAMENNVLNGVTAVITAVTSVIALLTPFA